MPGDAEEAEFIITDIENVRRQEGRPWEDFAILFRANTQSRIIEQTLREHKFPTAWWARKVFSTARR